MKIKTITRFFKIIKANCKDNWSTIANKISYKRKNMALFNKAIIIIWIAVFLFIFDYLKGPKNIDSVLHKIEEYANMTEPTQILFSRGKV
jgi:hypothetical protein